MHHHRRRLIQHAQSGGTHRERQIGVFVVGGREARVEAAELRKQRAWQGDRCAADVIGVAHVGVAAIIGIFEAPVIPAGAIGEHHPTRFLQTAVRIHQPGADQPHIGVLLERAQQCIQPARLRHGVVVEEDQEVAAGERGAVVAGGDETIVGRARMHADAVDFGEPGEGVVGRGIVDHDHFERGPRRMRGNRAQAGQGVRECAMHRDHDAGARQVRTGRLERREWFAGGGVQHVTGAAADPHLQLQTLPAGRPAAAAQAGPATSPQTQCAQVPEARVGGDRHVAKLRLKG